ncbi:hypothetical protein GH733_007010 [Mirounga leonina]|nr:hypothetical protein GH733_007010 [Mirounga leonina]
MSRHLWRGQVSSESLSKEKQEYGSILEQGWMHDSSVPCSVKGQPARKSSIKPGKPAATKMAGRLATFLKDAWAKQPVLVTSFTIGGLALILPTLSPSTKYATMINQAMAYNYPVPLQDDGNMPDVPSHPRKASGPRV